jgi:hypothetical protein
MRRAVVALLAATAAAPGAVAQAAGWYAMTHATRERQPHWITPLATLTPLLEQEYRFDLSATGHPAFTSWQFGGGKGLELIPSRSTELIVTQPTYASGGGVGGWGDAGALVKYRLAAAPESEGNYVVTATLGGSAPTGASGIGAGHGTLAPGVGWGKGWGRFDVQQAFSVSLPLSGTAVAGRQFRLDTAAQVHVGRLRAWPEVEWNAGWWDGGKNAGRSQGFVTGGVVFGPFPLHVKLGLTLGVGEQTAVSAYHLYEHAWTFSARLPF